MKEYSISFAGAGRVAGILCRALKDKGHHIGLVVSETEKRGQELAESCGAEWSSSLTFPETTDIIIVSVPDSRLKRVAQRIRCAPSTIVTHTAGSIGQEIFPVRMGNRGVFYPLQTFSAGRAISFEGLPVFIEASSENVENTLRDLAASLGANIYLSSAQQRRMLHLAAVFANNFANHMMTLGSELAFRSGYSFEELKPLVMETFLKVLEYGPVNSQTGPAVRKDKNTVRKHMELLSFDRDLKKIYSEITKSVSKYYNRK